jgi:hypothetical protein
MGRILAAVAVVFSLGACSHAGAPVAQTRPTPVPGLETAANWTYRDVALGFAIERPRGDGWRFSPGEGPAASASVEVPVIVAHRATGAQVVVQVAPAVATPTAFAKRLTDGLRARPGFTTTDVEPITLADGAVGFAFTMGDQVAGRVAVVGGGAGAGKVYVLLATWPQDAPPMVISGVDEIVKSLRTSSRI